MPRNNEPGMPKDKRSTGANPKWTKYNATPRDVQPHWDEVSAPLIGELVQAVTRDGSAVLLGVTRDGGALVVTICAGEDRAKFYGSTPEEIASMLHNVINIASD